MDADGGDADFKRRRSREGHLSASFSPRQREGERGDHSLLAPGLGGGEVRFCWAVRQRQTMAQQHGPRRRAIGRVRGGKAVSKHFPFSREAGGAASLPLDCFKVAAPAMDSPNEDGFPSILFCWSVSAASAPGLPRCANADRTEGVCGPLLAEGHAWGSAAWRRSADW